ncbi:MAG: cytochrome-c peroxidase [Chitinophagaceae bacterium]|nr:cytochrome-c peroxidase [Chitinophagaceae bacterium]
MKRYILVIFAFIIGGSLLLESCRRVQYVLPPFGATFQVPAGWPAPKYDFSQNPLTPEGVELGRYLFYDGRLSKDGNYPCASCHEQVSAFTHEDHPLAHGYGGSHSNRNPPGIYNMAWYSEYFQDGGMKKLEDVYLSHVSAPNEMGETIENVIEKLKADSKYTSMFRAAFGDPMINADRMTKALSQFVLTMVSSNSKYDRVQRGEATFTLSEQLGYDIFKTKCATCHKEPLFTDFSYRNIGMPLDADLKDKGRQQVTGSGNDSLKFRVLSLRNAQSTRPFGHDGRFFSFTNLYMHYNSGVVNGPTTDPIVAGGIPLSNFEQGQLTAFLNTLTDSVLINDPRFKKPQ